jgi:hypothetical protein
LEHTVNYLKDRKTSLFHIFDCQENSFVTPSLTLPSRGEGLGGGHFHRSSLPALACRTGRGKQGGRTRHIKFFHHFHVYWLLPMATHGLRIFLILYMF